MKRISTLKVTGNQTHWRQKLPSALTKRELETLSLAASGKTTAEIARELFISAETVQSHRKNIMRKLGARNMISAVTVAFRRKWME